MSKARINRASIGFDHRAKTPPCPEAFLVDTGRVFTNTGKPITHWGVEVNSLEDLARIAAGEQVIVDFNYDGTVGDITIYDDHIE